MISDGRKEVSKVCVPDGGKWAFYMQHIVLGRPIVDGVCCFVVAVIASTDHATDNDHPAKKRLPVCVCVCVCVCVSERERERE